MVAMDHNPKVVKVGQADLLRTCLQVLKPRKAAVLSGIFSLEEAAAAAKAQTTTKDRRDLHTKPFVVVPPFLK